MAQNGTLPPELGLILGIDHAAIDPETTMLVPNSRTAPAAASALRRWEAPVLTMLPLGAAGIGAATSRLEPVAPAAAANGAW